MADRPLAPAGLRLSLADGVRVADHGRVLVGGSPPRLVRLSAAGADRVDAWTRGEPIGAGRGERGLARRLLDAGIVHPEPSSPPTGAVHLVMPVRDEPGIVSVAAALAGDRPVLVVDDGSHEPIRPVDGVEVIRRRVPAGPGPARNEGLRRAAAHGAEFVVFADADVDAHPGWIESLLAHFSDPGVAAVAPRVRARVGLGGLDRYEMTFPSLDLGPNPASAGPGRSVAYVPSAALAVRVAAFDEVGGFDPDLRFGEDVDLVWRLVAAGHTVRYEPRVEVWHRARSNWRGWLAQRRAYGGSAAALAVRHGDALAPARAPLGVYATALAAIVTPPAVTAVTAVAETGAAQRRVRASLGEHHDPRLVIGGLVQALRSTVLAVVRAWLPAALLVALGGGRARRRLGVIVGAAVVAEVAESRRDLGWARSTVVRLVDHAAYGIGVWEGLIRVGRRGLPAVLPRLTRPGVRTETAGGDTVAP